MYSVRYKGLAGINKDVSFSILINSLLEQDRAPIPLVIIFRLNWPFLCMRANQSGLQRVEGYRAAPQQHSCDVGAKRSPSSIKFLSYLSIEF